MLKHISVLEVSQSGPQELLYQKHLVVHKMYSRPQSWSCCTQDVCGARQDKMNSLDKEVCRVSVLQRQHLNEKQVQVGLSVSHLWTARHSDNTWCDHTHCKSVSLQEILSASKSLCGSTMYMKRLCVIFNIIP